MTEFSVWAPAPAEVALWVPDGDPIPMRRDDDGWWRVELDHTGDYAFVVDGDRLPDPRSPHQPQGVDGPSRVVDHAALAWTDQTWHGRPLTGGVLYELHVGTFTPEGTFDAIIGRLDHLVGLGVDAIELMPPVEFPGRRGWGYDGVLLWAPHHAYGGPEGLARLVDACHARGLGVVVDVVYNHLGPSGNHLARFGPYFTDKFATPWGQAINLDGAGSDEVRAFICDNARMWIRDYHVDGLRLDAVHALFDQSAVHVLEAIGEAVHDEGARAGRTVTVIAESDLNDPRLVRPVEAGGYGLDAVWSDDFHHALRVALTGVRRGYYADFSGWHDVATALRDVYVHAGSYSGQRGRRHGRPVGELPRRRFLAYDQNHDQVGNTAAGARPFEPVQQLAAAALVLLGPFTPMLFQGEEWASTSRFAYFTDFTDPELVEAVRRGRREEFASHGWDPDTVLDPQDPATFESSVLDWTEPTRGVHADVLAGYRTLIALRRAISPDAEPVVGVHAEGFEMVRGDVTLDVALDGRRVRVEHHGAVVLDVRA